jgi:hypothetical protein
MRRTEANGLLLTPKQTRPEDKDISPSTYFLDELWGNFNPSYSPLEDVPPYVTAPGDFSKEIKDFFMNREISLIRRRFHLQAENSN